VRLVFTESSEETEHEQKPDFNEFDIIRDLNGEFKSVANFDNISVFKSRPVFKFVAESKGNSKFSFVQLMQ